MQSGHQRILLLMFVFFGMHTGVFAYYHAGELQKPEDSIASRHAQYSYSLNLGDTLQLQINVHHVTSLARNNSFIRVNAHPGNNLNFSWKSLNGGSILGKATQEVMFPKPGKYVLQINASIIDTVEIKEYTVKEVNHEYYQCKNSVKLSTAFSAKDGKWNVKKGHGSFSDIHSPEPYICSLDQGLNIFEWEQKEEGKVKTFEVFVFNQALQINLEEKHDEDCYGQNNGRAVFSVEGSKDYRLFWQGKATDKLRFSGLEPGSYVLKATNGSCVAEKQVTIEPARELTVQVKEKQQPATVFSEDGSLLVEAKGGTPPYQCSLSGKNGMRVHTAQKANLPAGEYTAVVRDGKDCLAQKRIELTPRKGLMDKLAINGNSSPGILRKTEYTVEYAGKGIKWNLSGKGHITHKEGNAISVVWDSAGEASIKASVKTADGIIKRKKRVNIRNDIDNPEECKKVSPGKDGKSRKLIIEDPSKYDLLVYSNGNIVRQITTYNNEWSGCDDEGEPLKAGEYTVVARHRKSGEKWLFKVSLSY